MQFIRKSPRATIFDLELIDERPGFICFQVKGKRAHQVFANEMGSHRWQRVPPTERKGRRQTSTITVAVLPLTKISNLNIQTSDLIYSTRRGGGPGGQHKNKTDSCVDLKHKPTGITVTVDGRKQHQNKVLALRILSAKLLARENERGIIERNKNRRQQVGGGTRGDKRRTIRVNDNQVIDHTLNKTISYKEYVKGNFDGWQ